MISLNYQRHSRRRADDDRGASPVPDLSQENRTAPDVVLRCSRCAGHGLPEHRAVAAAPLALLSDWLRAGAGISDKCMHWWQGRRRRPTRARRTCPDPVDSRCCGDLHSGRVGSLFAASCGFRRFPGGLPFLTNAACALLAVPSPYSQPAGPAAGAKAQGVIGLGSARGQQPRRRRGGCCAGPLRRRARRCVWRF